MAGLITGAIVWGLIWYPLRVLEVRGLLGSLSTTYVYGVAMVLGGIVFARELAQWRHAVAALLAIGIVAGWTNLSYVVAIIEGEVMRVMLLFYLAPLWTVIFARFLLAERLGPVGVVVVFTSLAGAVTMLWNPAHGLPVPINRAEWLGLSSGMGFALSNVLIRKHAQVSIGLKSVAVFIGVTLLAALWSLLAPSSNWAPALDASSYVLVVVLGIVILATNLAVQYGLSQTTATQAIVILLFELVVGAIGAYFLANEVMTTREWLGGALIVAASLLSGRLGDQPAPVLDEDGKVARSTAG